MSVKINKRHAPRQQKIEYYNNGSLKSVGDYTKRNGYPIGLISFFYEADLSKGVDNFEHAMVRLSDNYLTLPNQRGYEKKKKKWYELFSKPTKRYVPVGRLHKTELYDRWSGINLENKKQYYQNGNLETEMEYSSSGGGLSDAPFKRIVKIKEYYENGNLRSVYELLNDKRHGISVFYDENGNKSEIKYDEDEVKRENIDFDNDSSSYKVDTDDVRNLKRQIQQRNSVIKLNVFEELIADFQLADKNGEAVNSDDQNLETNSEDYLKNYDGYVDDWDSSARVYTGRISRNNSFKFSLDEFLVFLDEFIEEIESGDYGDQTSLEDFTNWVYDTHGMSFEEAAGGGSCEAFTAYGDNSKEYRVFTSHMHEQRAYDLEIIIESQM